MDEKRRVTAQLLLDAAHAFWGACHEEKQYGAVQWLTGTLGEMVIFTRGEYRDQLMRNIHALSGGEKIHKFGEEIDNINKQQPIAFYCGGALMVDREIDNITRGPLNGCSRKYYGGKWMICETISQSAAKKIALALGLGWSDASLTHDGE